MNLQATIGVVQLGKIERFIEKKRGIAGGLRGGAAFG
jgi:dTDP-4-amino-4,6-dideoxygalactose transaminase